MRIVIKVGGSFQKAPSALRSVCMTIEEISKKHRLLIVPGGGKFADLIRDIQTKLGLSDRVAHQMAILGMDIYGLALSEFLKDFALVDDLKNREGENQIFLPYRTLKDSNELEPSWKVTSDTIAAWTCSKTDFEKLILIKRVDGIHIQGKLRKSISTEELKEMNQTVVDQNLFHILEDAELDCWIINGEHPSRIKSLIEGKETICTMIYS
ncbi:hypothetical protein AKJ47_02600 [candidate division MSBL1 archaeon SCGC-AAA261G05]|uniref:Aspartate/glutamate/uridylate kinase domain-containing protein n=2 Tax=candidate division MSBL1 TaxID=215777 RepID=A0A133V166_9EURY|nr:hypothetical protein AKJ42_01520 [candidate division MSBL1 archaeon SCGC-AAA261C02]KXB03245.1 hypothetical protein AKJ47_02600 [candidate division MSBL1 archaeon SCGC-AAA261G05]